jgi:hypothetical protein
MGWAEVVFALFTQCSADCDEQTAGYAEGLFMASRETVIVGRFYEPAESVLSARPEHEIQHGFGRD